MDERAGEILRKQALSLLSARYGTVKSEMRVAGKRADLYFTHQHLGRREKVFVECKDYAGPLQRHQIEKIWAAYEGVVRRNAPALLLVVTRNGLTPDADAFIDAEHHELRHETIWDVENNVLGLHDYTRSLCPLFNEDGLSTYYIEARAIELEYDPRSNTVRREIAVGSIYERLLQWIDGEDAQPVAILAGYGAGKSSLAKRIVSLQANRCIENPAARSPVLIKLGAFTGHTRLEGLLGAMFTYDFPVPSFNTHRFLDLNEQGRLLIVLDGFDEMKHAMTFADFRSQLIELNKLVRGNSRIVLLGRPNAFLSVDERYYVLRGRSRLSDSEWHKIPGWPEFREFKLSDFSPEERHLFVLQYLQYVTSQGGQLDSKDWAAKRAMEVNRIAEGDEDVFGKPVHAKILSDLASDPHVDISTLGKRVGRWKLYSLFFKSLVQKEVEKDARRAIGEESRLQFLRNLAFWLWTEHAGQTAFHSFDIPTSLLNVVPDGESTDLDSKRREYLTGAFLEEKYGGTYFFHHRSFAEFLVAEYMYFNQPEGPAHSVYAGILKEGVAEFLLEAPEPEKVANWAKGLNDCSDPLPLRYLDFLARLIGGSGSLQKVCERNSPWRAFLACFDSDISLASVRTDSALEIIREGQEPECLMAISLLLWRCVPDATLESPIKAVEEVLSAAFDRIFRGAESNLLHEMKVLSSNRFLGELLPSGVERGPGFQPTKKATWTLRIKLGALITAVDEALKKRGISISYEIPPAAETAQLILSVTDMSPRMKRPVRPHFLEFVERNSSFQELPYYDKERRRTLRP